MTAEQARLAAGREWRRWGPYLAERAWGTVREDYSADGQAWGSFPHDHARSRVYRWNEDGLAGFCDDRQILCFAPALWNGHDPILKERLFGLSGPEGNHGEDVKEYWFPLEGTPTHSYTSVLYRYPLAEYPYERLVAENARRTSHEPEFELLETGVLDDGRFADVLVEYAKADPDDVVIRVTVTNRGPEPATLDLLGTLWFRNTWSWGRDHYRPELRAGGEMPGRRQRSASIVGEHRDLGPIELTCDGPGGLLFTDNETNTERLWGVANTHRYVKDAFHDAVVGGRTEAVNPAAVGTKAAARWTWTIAPGASRVATMRLRTGPRLAAHPLASAAEVLTRRRRETDEFYAAVLPEGLDPSRCLVARRALAGALWSRQFFHYRVGEWLEGDPAMPPPPASRRSGRNHDWTHLAAADIIAMPDTWEYPWFAAWDTAFHCLTQALVDPWFAKSQLLLLTRETYQHPNGQVPAYEWDLQDVNPPVLAWSTWRVCEVERERGGGVDRDFLERMFHKLLLAFTWWVNRRDSEGHNVFQGGFLGLDNIGVFDRSAALPTGGHLEQSDGTAWMGLFSLSMLRIALELARDNPVYEDLATKFFEHFLYIAAAMRDIAGEGISLWDDDEGFFHDLVHLPDGRHLRLRIRSMVGLIPMLAVESLDASVLQAVPAFKQRMSRFLQANPELAALVSRCDEPGSDGTYLLALVGPERLARLLKRVLDPREFLSEYGVRSLSRSHLEEPFRLNVQGREHEVRYEAGESSTALFGGNSNWRGPIWFPLNYLLIHALRRHHDYYGADLTVECPTGSHRRATLAEVASDLSERLVALFLPDDQGRRPSLAAEPALHADPRWREAVLFHEYFHGDTGAGLGASHQTGWTALVANLIVESASRPIEQA